MKDDRAEFEAEKKADSAALLADEEVQRLNLDLTAAADRHNFSYLWTWLGVPVIQTPTDIVVLQDIVWRARPEVIIETGVARGGSMILGASLLELVGGGRVVGVDIDIRAHNRAVIEAHPLAHRIRLIEGPSLDPTVLESVRNEIGDATRVMVILDSDHAHDHVLGELRAYSEFVTPDQYLVVADTIVELIPQQEHRLRHWGPGNNPMTARDEFLAEVTSFVEDTDLNARLLLSSSPRGYLRRVG